VTEPFTGNSPAASLPITLSLPWLAVLVLLYVLLGYLSLRLIAGNGLEPTIWPAAGLAAALVLTAGPRALWVPLLGNLVLTVMLARQMELSWVNSAAMAVGFAVANTGEAWFIHRASAGYGPGRLYDGRAFLRFAVFAAPIGCLFSAVVGVATLLAFVGPSAWQPGTRIVLWWSGDLLGCLLLAPVLLTMTRRKPPLWQLLEFAGLALLAGLYLYLLLTPVLHATDWPVVLAPLGLPLLCWALVRLRLFYLTMLLMLIGVAFVAAHFHGVGPFQLDTPILSSLALQFSLISFLVTSVMAATVLRERRQLNQGLMIANQNLEAQVRDRTRTIQNQSQRLHEIVDALPLALTVRAASGETVIANRAAQQLTMSEPDWLRAARESVALNASSATEVSGAIIDRNGHTRQLSVQMVSLHDEH